MVYGSSFHVYGPGLQGEVDEGRPYGALRDLAHLSKVYAEKLGEMMALTEGVPCSPVRLGIVYGLGPVTKSDLRFVTAPHAFCLRAIAGEPLPIHPAGLHPAGYVHLADAVAALRLAAGLPARERPYVPANAVSETASALDVARLVQRTAWEAGYDATLRRHTPQAPAGEEDTSRDSRGASVYRAVRAGRGRLAPHGHPGGGPAPNLRPLRRRALRDDRAGPGGVNRPMSAPGRESPRILLKARPLPQQLADRLAPPAPDGMELYIHEADVTGDGWLEALSGHIGAAPLP